MKLIGWLLALGQAVVHAAHLNIFTSDTGELASTTNQPSFSRRLVNVKEVHEGPVVILAPEEQDTGVLRAFIAPRGLSSLSDNRNFETFHKYLLQHEELSGLVFFPGDPSSNVFLKSKVLEVTLPDKFKTANLLQLSKNPTVPFVYISPQDVFDRYHFSGLNQLATISVSNEQIVVSEVFDPFDHLLHQVDGAPGDPHLPSSQEQQEGTQTSNSKLELLSSSEEVEGRDVSEHVPETSENLEPRTVPEGVAQFGSSSKEAEGRDVSEHVPETSEKLEPRRVPEEVAQFGSSSEESVDSDVSEHLQESLETPTE